MRYVRTKSGVGLMVMFALLASVALLRADPGDLDLTFGGGDGYLTTDVGNYSDRTTSLVIDSAGKIIIVGESIIGNFEPEISLGPIIRYNSDGTLDSSFGNSGMVIISTATLDSVTLDHSGQILVAGANNGNALLARFNPDGSPDLTFGDQGVVIAQIWSQATAVSVDQNDKIALILNDYYNNKFYLLRYNEDGTPDLTFGDQGEIRIPVMGYTTSNLLINSDGSIVIAGYTNDEGANSTDIVLAKFTSDGLLDWNFGENGVVITDLNYRDEINQVIVDRIGRILVVGSSVINENQLISDVLVARYLANGTLDNTFSEDGILLTPGDMSEEYKGYSVVIDPLDRLIVAGFSYPENTGIFLARYYSDGTLDTSFNSDVDNGGNFPAGAMAIDVKLDKVGKIIIAGIYDADFFVARYESGFVPTDTPTITYTPTPTNTTEVIEPSKTVTSTPTLTETPESTVTTTFTPTLTETPIEPSVTASSTPEITNLIANGGFEVNGGSSASWELKRGTDDKVKCDKPGKPVAYEGECAFRFKGSVGENSQVFQKPDLDGLTFNVGDGFTLQAYIYARGQVDFQAQAKFTYADDTKTKIALDVTAVTDGYTVFADDYALTDASLVKVKVALKNKSASGKLDVDAMSLNYTTAGSSLLPLP